MNTTQLIALTIALLILNSVFVIGLDRAPARGLTIGPDNEDEGLYPIIEPPTGWRSHWRSVCIAGAILTTSAIAAAHLTGVKGEGWEVPARVPTPCRNAL
ncbi:hypothetical protein AB4Z39_33330 [Mycobacterium adipatum]|uniref:hypothetical protein n=1 Tax=Mycobacterium adipatum TaxID=1682113 RepID=UPI0034E0C769